MPIRIRPPAVPLLVAVLAAGIANAQTIGTDRFTCEVADTAEATVLTARLKGSDEPVRLRIRWLAGDTPPSDFKNVAGEKDRIASSHLIGKTTVTRTILAGEEAGCILIHVIADQPGVIAFQARFEDGARAKIRNRRELVFTGGKIHAHAWIIPFESDVEDDGKATVSVKGEGEALIALNLSEDTEMRPIADTWLRLGQRFDPGHTPPNPHLVWEGVKKAQEPKTQDTRKE